MSAVPGPAEPESRCDDDQQRDERRFVHPDTDLFIEFPAPPLAIGNEPVTKIAEQRLPTGAAKDAAALLGPWLTQRRMEGAGPEDLVFPCPTRDGLCYRKELIEARWEAVAKKLGLSMTFYQATRHSFASATCRAGPPSMKSAPPWATAHPP